MRRSYTASSAVVLLDHIESDVYCAGDNSLEDASEFITQQFQKHMPDKKKFFAFATNATDTRNIDLVFGSAVAHIVDQNLKATGLQE